MAAFSNNNTPVKTVQIDCFICQKSGLSKKIRLGGKKCLGSGFRFKILDLVGSGLSSFFDSFSDEASVCRTCFSLVDRFQEFQATVRSAVKSFKSVREKRLSHFSPSVV